jgi:gluconokinase
LRKSTIFIRRRTSPRCAKGIPLDDSDRFPWLQAIAAQIDRWRAEGRSGVVTCSALKRRYRDIIIGDRPEVRLVYLKGDRELIAHRLAARHGHFMPASLLESQFADLEEPRPDERPIIVSIGDPPSVLVEKIMAALNLSRPPGIVCQPPAPATG